MHPMEQSLTSIQIQVTPGYMPRVTGVRGNIGLGCAHLNARRLCTLAAYGAISMFAAQAALARSAECSAAAWCSSGLPHGSAAWSAPDLEGHFSDAPFPRINNFSDEVVLQSRESSGGRHLARANCIPGLHVHAAVDRLPAERRPLLLPWPGPPGRRDSSAPPSTTRPF